MLYFRDFALLFFIVDMMVLGFALLYILFAREEVSRKLFMAISITIGLFGEISLVLSGILFWSLDVIVGVVIILVSLFLYIIPYKTQPGMVRWKESRNYSAIVVGLLLFYEVTMGYFYGSAFLPHSMGPLLLSIDNLDFSIMMIADAVFFFALSRKRKDLPEIALFTFAISMALMPNFFLMYGNAAILISLLSSSTIMIIDIVMLYVIQMRNYSLNLQLLTLTLAASDLIMMLGLSSLAVSQSPMFLALGMLFSMAAYFVFVTYRVSTKKVRRIKRLSLGLLVFINGAELSMSLAVSSLGMQTSMMLFHSASANYASVFGYLQAGMVKSLDFKNPLWWLFPFDPVKMGHMGFMAGLSVSKPFAYFWYSFMLIMSTTMSPFYAIMMGSEMSYLVLERYRESKDRKVKNWAIAILVGIPIFVILIPFYSPAYIFGMSGMLFFTPVLIVLISIAAIIVASVFFGRRVQCNLVCMAAHMWTNSYYDRFKPAKNNFVWEIVRWISFSAMILSFSLFALVQAGVIKPIMIGKVMINPLDFYGMFVLNYIWWFFYFLTPIFGTYSCARHGWCGFGTLSGIFNKIFFRINASDVSICSSCTTRSCEKSCPTSIPLAMDFGKKGFSNRIACIGCGDCVESCEFDNLQILDVRNRLAKKDAHTSKNIDR